jgi:hypothetical protein
MTPGRNVPCPCGSGRKYKRCCLPRDEAREHEQRAARAERARLLALPTAEAEVEETLAPSLQAVIAKDRGRMTGLLERFAELLTTEELLSDIRFDEHAFARAVELSFPRRGTTVGARGTPRLFKRAVGQLANRGTVRRLHDQLARTMAAAVLEPAAREAVAAALVCLQPVVEGGIHPRESPTLEIVFNVQLDAWTARRLHAPPQGTRDPARRFVRP